MQTQTYSPAGRKESHSFQPLHKIVEYNSAGNIRSATVYIDLDCNLFRVVYSNDCQADAFYSQESAEKAAQDFVNKELP